MGIFGLFSNWGRRRDGASRIKAPKSRGKAPTQRGFEMLEDRRLMAADVHIGAVYYEAGTNDDSIGDIIHVTFQGGAPGTQLKHLEINGDKLGDGLTNGDVFFDTAPGGRGVFKSVPLSIISQNGFTITNVSVVDGGTKIAFDFDGFEAGDTLVFTIDVDEQGFFADSATAVAEGGEFEGSRLDATFTAPHYQDISTDPNNPVRFYDFYDQNFADADAATGSQLNLPPDSYIPPATTDQVDLTAGAVTHFKQVPKPNSISGTVFYDPNLNNQEDAGEHGLSGVSLTLYHLVNGSYVSTGLTTTTDANGNYHFNNLLPDTYRVVETQPSGLLSVGAKAGTVDGVTRGAVETVDIVKDITLLGGEDSVHNDFAEVAPSTLAGKVHVDMDGDCMYTPGDLPLPGVTIELRDAQGNVIKTAITDSNGDYKFTGLLPGEYTVHEIQPAGYLDSGEMAGSVGGVILVNDTISQIHLPDATDAVHYDFCEVLPGSISGQVHADPEGDCLIGPNDILLKGVTIQLLDSDGKVIRTTTTDDQGFYHFTNLVPATYGVHMITPNGYFDHEAEVGSGGGKELNAETLTEIPVGSDQDLVEYDFCLNMPGKISGFVHADPEGDCVIGPNDIMLKGVTIQLLDSQGHVVGSTTTNDQGFYQFTGLEPGTYGVHMITPSGYFDHEAEVGSGGGEELNGDTLDKIPLTSNADLTEYDFCLELPGSISGYVHADPEGDCLIGPNDIMLSGVTIQLLDSEGQVLKSTTTNDAGYYEFLDIGPGKYSVREIQPAGYLQGESEVGSGDGISVNPDLLSEIDIAPNDKLVHYDFCEHVPSSIRGHVEFAPTGDCDEQEGPPLVGVQIDLLDSEGTLLKTTFTDSNGDYLFDQLQPGVYAVREHQPTGYLQGDEHVGSVGGDISVVDLISNIDLNPAADGVGYDFCETLPATLSGYVFQDGPAIVNDPAHPVNPFNVRDGVKKSGDPAIAGVVLHLADFAGLPVLDDSGHPIVTTTDANGFYQFTGLRPGQYSVLEGQPAGYADWLDTPGTAGGLAVNVLPDGSQPGPVFGLAIDPHNDAILRVTLMGGDHSQNNNFSELRFVDEPPPPPPPPPRDSLPPLPPPALGGVTPTIPVIPFLAVAVERPDIHDTMPSLDYTWHLSIIDAGYPRGPNENSEALAQLTGTRLDAQPWSRADLQQGHWKLNTENGPGPLEHIFGMAGAIPVTGDFNGDGRTEVGVFIDGQWFIDMNGNGIWDAGDMWAKLGNAGDIPVVGDWDGDGKDDIGIFGRIWEGDLRAIAAEPGIPDPFNLPNGKMKNMPPEPHQATLGARSLKLTSQGKMRNDVIDHVFHFGTAGDVPVVGDWNGDGVRTIGVFRNGVWYVDVDGDGKWTSADAAYEFGQPGDKPLVGDWTGDGIDKIGVYRNGIFYLDTNNNHKLDPEDRVVKLGEPGDVPVVGDWNGDGKDEVGVFHQGVVERPVTSE